MPGKQAAGILDTGRPLEDRLRHVADRRDQTQHGSDQHSHAGTDTGRVGSADSATPATAPPATADPINPATPPTTVFPGLTL